MAELARFTAPVVTNTVGPFTEIALAVIRAADRASHHVGLSSEFDGLIELPRVRTSRQPLLERARTRDRLERLPKWDL